MMRARCTAVAASVLVLAASPAYAEPPQVAQANLTEVRLDKQQWQVGEQPVARGQLRESDGAPIAGATVTVIVDGDEQHPAAARTDAQGNWQATVTFSPGRDGVGGHGILAQYAGDPQHLPAQATTDFIITAPPAPTTLTVNPVTAPVAPGQQLVISGTARDQHNQPVQDQGIYLVDALGRPTGLTSTNPDGSWTSSFTVPADAGGVAGFPAYAMTVVLPGDFVISETRAPLGLTLSTKVAVTPAPAPSFAPQPVLQSDRPTAARPEYPTNDVGFSMHRLVNPVQLWLGGGIVCSVFGSAMLSHALRRRRMNASPREQLDLLGLHDEPDLTARV